MHGKVDIQQNHEALIHRIAEWFIDAAAASTGPFRVNLSGGSTPEALYTYLATNTCRDRIPWDRVFWYWGDERFVPHDHADSNYRMVHRALLSKVPVPPQNIVPIPTDSTPEIVARQYEHTLQQTYGSSTLDPNRPLFDLSIYGLGPDGHTASLIPDQPVLDERTRWVVSVPHGRPEVRITMTYPALESSRLAAFLVSGSTKAPVFSAIRAEESDVPAARLNPLGELIWFVDRDAAGMNSHTADGHAT